MTPPTVFVSKPAKRASAVVLVDDDVARAQVGEASAAGRGPLRVGRVERLAAVEQPVLGDRRRACSRGAMKPSRRSASCEAQARALGAAPQLRLAARARL